jgi:hypothetical protein
MIFVRHDIQGDQGTAGRHEASHHRAVRAGSHHIVMHGARPRRPCSDMADERAGSAFRPGQRHPRVHGRRADQARSDAPIDHASRRVPDPLPIGTGLA